MPKQVKSNQRVGSDTPVSGIAKQRKDSSGSSRRPPPQTRPSSSAPNIAQHTMIPAQTASTGHTDPTSQYPNTATDDDKDSVTTIDTSASIQRPDTPPASPVEPSKELVAAVVQRIASAVSLTPVPSDTDLVMRSSGASRAQDLPVVAQVRREPVLERASAQLQIHEVAQLFKDVVQHIISPPQVPIASTTSQDKSEGVATPPMRGSRMEVKEVYEAWDSKEYAYKLQEPPVPSQVTDLDTFAFVIRTRALRSDPRSVVFVDINLPGLRDILRVVLKDIKWLSLADDKPSFEQNLLYHYLPDLEKYLQSASKDKKPPNDSLKALALLISTIEDRHKLTSERLKPLLQANKITYDLLWALFKANERVVTTCIGSDQLKCLQYQMGEEKKTDQGAEYFQVQCQYLDYDGNVFGFVTDHVRITRFNGARPVTDLDVYPLAFQSSSNEMLKSFIDRGHKFISLMGSHYREYDGIAFRRVKDGLIRISVRSRVIVDARQFRKVIPGYARIVKKKTEQDIFSIRAEVEQRVAHYNADPATLSGDMLAICPPTVLGFSLGNKFWGEYSVDHIHNIQWQSTLFEHLSIPPGVKNTLKSMTQALTKNASERGATASSSSVVGHGIRMLLHGPPGVGKTLTAETLAEYHRRPLYSVSTGELSSDAAELEPQLTNIFRAAAAWRAILLIDEADVFLQKRTSQTLERNRLVGIFLRELEYFEGILILTTNRVDDIDPAILDRMHLQIPYFPLDKSAKKEIFTDMLSGLCGKERVASLGFDFINRLTAMPVNGRQIKNTLSIANTLANSEDEILSSEHIKQALAVSNLWLPDHSDEDDLYA